MGLRCRLTSCDIRGCRRSASLHDRAPRIVATDSHHAASCGRHAPAVTAVPPERVGAKTDSTIGKPTRHGPG